MTINDLIGLVVIAVLALVLLLPLGGDVNGQIGHDELDHDYCEPVWAIDRGFGCGPEEDSSCQPFGCETKANMIQTSKDEDNGSSSSGNEDSGSGDDNVSGNVG